MRTDLQRMASPASVVRCSQVGAGWTSMKYRDDESAFDQRQHNGVDGDRDASGGDVR